MERIPLFPLSHGLFPDGMLHLNIFEVRYLDLIRRCHREDTPFGVVWLAQGTEVQVPGQVPQFHTMGCLAHVQQLHTLQPALLQICCLGGLRFVLHGHEAGPFGVWYADVEFITPDAATPIPAHLQPMANLLGQLIADGQNREASQALPIFAPYRLDECGWVANRWAEILPVSVQDKLRLLAEENPAERLVQVSRYIDV